MKRTVCVTARGVPCFTLATDDGVDTAPGSEDDWGAVVGCGAEFVNSRGRTARQFRGGKGWQMPTLL
jgi:hypothetical protein